MNPGVPLLIVTSVFLKLYVKFKNCMYSLRPILDILYKNENLSLREVDLKELRSTSIVRFGSRELARAPRYKFLVF